METGNTKEKYFYYGLVIFYLITLLFDVLRICVYYVVGYLELNLIIVPIVLLILCALILYLLFATKTFHQIKNWQVITAILLFFAAKYLLSYDKYLGNYILIEKGLIYSYVFGVKYLFMFTLTIIAFLKYNKIKE